MKMLVPHATHLEGDSSLGGEVSVPAIRELRLERSPPEVVLLDGRVGFVQAGHRRDLELFGRLHGLPFVTRDDVWALLAEPFLDTEFDAPQQAATLARLAESGLLAEEVAAIRGFVGPRMSALVAATWEWVHLGLYDVLSAPSLGVLSPRAPDPVYGPPDRSRAAFRRWAEEIGHRGVLRDSSSRLPEPSTEEVLERLRWRFPLGLDALRDALIAAWCAPHRHYHGPRHLLAVLDGVTSATPRDAFTLAAYFHDAIYDPTRADNEARSAEWLDTATPQLIAAGVAAEDVALARALVVATARPLDDRPSDFRVCRKTSDSLRTRLAGHLAAYVLAPSVAVALLRLGRSLRARSRADPPSTPSLKPLILRQTLTGRAIRRFLDADFGIFASLPDEYDAYVRGVRAEFAFVPDPLFEAGRRDFLDRLHATVERRGYFFSEATPLAEHLARANLARERGA